MKIVAQAALSGRVSATTLTLALRIMQYAVLREWEALSANDIQEILELLWQLCAHPGLEWRVLGKHPLPLHLPVLRGAATRRQVPGSWRRVWQQRRVCDEASRLPPIRPGTTRESDGPLRV